MNVLRLYQDGWCRMKGNERLICLNRGKSGGGGYAPASSVQKLYTPSEMSRTCTSCHIMVNSIQKDMSRSGYIWRITNAYKLESLHS